MPRLLKSRATRMRRNKASTRATLPPAGSGPIPALPKHRRKWHPMTAAWWREFWASPMASQVLAADRHALYVVLELVERFWKKPGTALAKEIRQASQAFGTDPLARRRLQWEMKPPQATPDEAPDALPVEPAVDPRQVLRMVK